MFTHMMVGANVVEASKKFYDAVLGEIGIPPGKYDDRGRVFYRSGGMSFGITKPINGEPACPANGATIGFAVDSPEAADRWHAAGVANGGTSCEDPPGVREGSMARLYLAYLRDPAGNKICALKRV